MGVKLKTVVLGLGLALAASFGVGAEASAEGSTRRAEPPAAGLAVATFAGGCFWCMEPPFDRLEEVVSTTSGYTGGTTAGPSYKQVSAGGTGHAEAVRVVYDPAKVDYRTLLEVFWRNVDPLDAAGQFCDKGDEYRPAVFAHDEEQRRLAEASKAALATSGRFERPVVVAIEPARGFYVAEDYHQDYYLKNPVRYRYYSVWTAPLAQASCGLGRVGQFACLYPASWERSQRPNGKSARAGLNRWPAYKWPR